MKPTLIVCIGGSGMKIGHAIKYHFVRYMPEELLSHDGKNGHVKFCFIENDATEFDRVKKYCRGFKEVFDESEMIRIGNINANRVVTDLTNTIKAGKKLSNVQKDISGWLDTKINFPDIITETGLAANRQLGRIALATSYDTLYKTLNSIVENLISVAGGKDKLEANSISVYIITGICGGTGSSMFLDISAMLDLLIGLHQSPKKKAVFINTNYFLDQKISTGITPIKDEYKNLQINSWALINECEFFAKKTTSDQSLLGKCTSNATYHTTRVQDGYPYTPFTNALLFDNHCSNQRIIPLGSFYSVIGDILFHTITSQSSAEFESKIETNKFFGGSRNEGDDIDYGSIAFKTIKFPSEELARYFRQRYLYEVFKLGLLKKDFKTASVQKKAEEFIKEVFYHSSEGIFAIAGQDYKNNLFNYSNLQDILTIDQYLLGESNSKLISSKELYEVLSNHMQFLKQVKYESDAALDSMPDFGFSFSFNDRPNLADQLRKQLWDYCYEIILNFGYFGILGIRSENSESKGFLAEIYDILKSNYVELTAYKNSWNESQFLTEVENSRLALSAKFERKFSLSSKTIQSVKNEIDAYHIAIRNYCDRLFEYNACRIKQHILYQFAIGNDKTILNDSFYSRPLESQTDLKKYERSLSIGVGTALLHDDELTSLIREYDRGKDDNSITIRNRFVKFLPNEFDETMNDLFTVFIPRDLSSYTDSSEPERWRKGTVIDKKYEDYVSTGPGELSWIFYNTTNENKYLLTRLGENSERQNSNVKKIINLIDDKFVEKYIKNTTSGIAAFLNQNIQEAYLECSENVRESILSSFNNLIFPACDVTTDRKIDPFINVSTSLKKFIIDEFHIDKNRIVEHEKLPMNQIVVIGHAGDILYSKITNSSLSRIEYDSRDRKKYRPHLNQEWNEFVNGPFDTFSSSLIPINDDTNYEVSDAFLICYFIDKIVQLDPSIHNSIFVENGIILTSNNGINKCPISFNKATKSFVLYNTGKVFDENKSEKFYIDVRDNRSGTNLGNLFATLEFSKAFSILKNDKKFHDTFKNFIYVLEQNKSLITQLFTDEVLNNISSEIISTKADLDKAQRRKGILADPDKAIIADFSVKTRDLAYALFEISLRNI